MRTTLPLVLAVLLSSTATPQTQVPPSRAELERQQAIDQAVSKIDEMIGLIEQSTREAKVGCMKAFGHAKFCQCVADNMQIVSTFEQYVIANTKTDQELNYSKLSTEQRVVIDMARTARDKCVKVL